MQVVVFLHIIITTAAVVYPVVVILGLVLFFLLQFHPKVILAVGICLSIFRLLTSIWKIFQSSNLLELDVYSKIYIRIMLSDQKDAKFKECSNCHVCYCQKPYSWF